MSKEKVQKTDVNYRNGADDNVCANCEHFVQPNECMQVDGLVHGSAICDLFSPITQQSGAASAETFMNML